MTLQETFSLQIRAFHTAIIDDCDRANMAEQTDVMALRLRNNAVALAKMQLALLAATRDDTVTQASEVEPEAVKTPSSPQPHLLSGDALSRFVSGRLEPDQSPHEAWLKLHEADPPKRRRDQEIGTGFRSPSS